MYPQDEYSKTLRRIPWFADLTQEQIDRLATITSLHHLEAGDILFREGDREDMLYILLEGQVNLQVEVPTRGQVTVFTAELLDVLGWSSLTPIVRQRTASAYASQASTLVSFNSKLLQQMCDEDHELGYVIMKRLANVVANRLLTTRLCMLDMLSHTIPV